MKTWHFIIDVEKCENCNNCFLACKDEHCGNDWPGCAAEQPRHGHRWMNIHARERGRFPVIDVAYLPMPCMHCADAPCIRAAADRSVFRRPDGIVIIDPEKARGRKDLVKSCPYGAVWWNEEKGLPQKCTFCAHLLDDGWKSPRCVQACPTGALTAVCMDEAALAERIRAEKLETLSRGSEATRPGVYYKNLYRFTRCFIAGSVATMAGGVEECVPGATVTLHKAPNLVRTATTDAFGEFKFDNLAEGSGEYRIEIACADGRRAESAASLGESCSVGTVWV